MVGNICSAGLSILFLMHLKPRKIIPFIPVIPDFKAKTRCSLYVCSGSSCQTYSQNESILDKTNIMISSYYIKAKHDSLRKLSNTTDSQAIGTPAKRTPRQGTPYLHHLLNSIHNGGIKQVWVHLWLILRK
jgi:hypothetical protein